MDEALDTSAIAVIARRPVIPVLTIRDVEHAVPLARALAAGGLEVMEVTLRTQAALEAIERIAAELPEVVVGAGTVRAPADITHAVRAGAHFLVSPGAPPTIMDAAADATVPFLPAVATATELMALAERGFDFLKFFPAEAAGSIAALKSFAGPFSDVRFCPTGGVGAGNAAAYLALPNVACVGGSWVAPDEAVAAGDWGRIEALAREASGFGAEGR